MYIFYIYIGDFGNMYKTNFSFRQLHKRSKICDTSNFTFNDCTNFE